MSLQQACKLSTDTQVRFATLLHDLGKGTTPEDEWPRHIGHEARNTVLITGLCDRIAAPKDYRELALIVGKFHTHCHRAQELRPATLLELLQQTDAFRRPQRFEHFLQCCEADARGRTGFEERDYPQANYLRSALQTCQVIDFKAIADKGFTGKDFGDELDRQRLQQLAQLKNNNSQDAS
jgi:tRNA nucleotidyltransferase (CCA-adding enzyme)